MLRGRAIICGQCLDALLSACAAGGATGAAGDGASTAVNPGELLLVLLLLPPSVGADALGVTAAKRVVSLTLHLEVGREEAVARAQPGTSAATEGKPGAASSSVSERVLLLHMHGDPAGGAQLFWSRGHAALLVAAR